MSEAIYWMFLGACSIVIIIVFYNILVDDIRERVMKELEKGGKKK